MTTSTANTSGEHHPETSQTLDRGLRALEELAEVPGGLTVTELADTLVRREGMSFHEAHSLVAQTVHACGLNDDVATIATTLMGIRPTLTLTRAEIELALDPEHVAAGPVNGPCHAPKTTPPPDRPRAGSDGRGFPATT